MVIALRVWRLCQDSRAPTTFSGEGSFRYGERWSPPGLAVVYCAESRPLAAMEILVHHSGTNIFKTARWTLLSADIPEALIGKPILVPKDWRERSPVASSQAIGAEWARTGRSVASRVPSTFVPGECNYLLNPAHPAFSKVKVGAAEPFAFGVRLER